MGFFDFLFGEDPETTVAPTSTLSKDQEAASKTLLDFIQGSGRPGGGAKFNGGALAGQVGDIQNLSLSALEDRAKALAVGDPQLQAASEALTSIITRGPQDINSFFDTNVKNPLLETFREDVQPAISSRFSDNFFSSDRRNADTKANEALIESLTKGRSDLAFRARESDTNAILSAIGLVPQIGQAGTNELMSILSSSSGALNEEFSRFVREQEIANQRARIASGFIAGPQLENIVTQTEGSPGLLGTLVGAAAGAAGGPIGSAIGKKIAGALIL